MHWVTLTNHDCPPNTVTLYDTLHGPIPEFAKLCASRLLKTQGNHFTILRPAVQVQVEKECAMYAIGFAIAVLLGTKHIEKMPHFIEHKMRGAYLEMLSGKKSLSLFPQYAKGFKSPHDIVPPPDMEVVTVQCLCKTAKINIYRLVEKDRKSMRKAVDKDCPKDLTTASISCLKTSCLTPLVKYHPSCVGVKDSASFTCSACAQASKK
jgi:hypothetical protein